MSGLEIENYELEYQQEWLLDLEDIEREIDELYSDTLVDDKENEE